MQQKKLQYGVFFICIGFRVRSGPFQCEMGRHCGIKSFLTLLEDQRGSRTMNGHAGREEVDNQKGKHAAMFVCWLLGIGCLIPWNSMLNVEDYYVHLFPKYHSTRMITISYGPSTFISIAILAKYEATINTRIRNLIGYTLLFLCASSLIVLDLSTAGRGGIGAFIYVCITSGAYGLGDALVQGGMVGDLSLMCPEFIQSYFAGVAAAGALISVLRLTTKAAFENTKDGLRIGALLFFSVAALFELLCILLYAFVFTKLPIVKYYRLKAAAEGSKTVVGDLAAAGLQNGMEDDAAQHQTACLSHKQLFLQNVNYAIVLYLTFVLTLSIFPGFLSEDVGEHKLGQWYVLVIIAMFNMCDLIGRYIPVVESLKLKSRRGLMIASLSRFLIVPAFYFTAKYGGEVWMLMLTSWLGATNGYLAVCVLTEAPKGYKGPEQNGLGNLLSVCLSGGILSGVLLDWLWLIGKGW